MGRVRVASPVRAMVLVRATVLGRAAELNQREVYDLKRIQHQLAADAALVCWLDIGYPTSAAPSPSLMPQEEKGVAGDAADSQKPTAGSR